MQKEIKTVYGTEVEKSNPLKGNTRLVAYAEKLGIVKEKENHNEQVEGGQA